jgi:hypothetical protein
MATQANITSTEALDAFRSSLIVFLAKAKRSLDDATEEVRRTRGWLQNDCKSRWEGEFRRRTKMLQQAQQELMSVRLASHQESALMARQAAVAKAQRDLADAEMKLRKVNGWNQRFDTASDPILKRMETLRQALNDLPKAIAYLTSIQKTLEAYAESAGPIATPVPSTPPEPERQE